MDKATSRFTEINYDLVPYAVRDDLVAAQNKAWKQLSEPGAWLEGQQRLNVAQEARVAWDCDLCGQRKDALSPYAIDEDHDHITDLKPAEIEIIHRISTDSGRLSEAWLKGQMKAGAISEETYVEIISIIGKVLMIDRFAEALGQAEFSLPEPASGAPSGRRAAGAKMHDAWISLVIPHDVTPADGNLYDGEVQPAGVVKALSLVPDAKQAYWDLGDAHYIPNTDLLKFDLEQREITRAQVEVVAPGFRRFINASTEPPDMQTCSVRAIGNPEQNLSTV